MGKKSQQQLAAFDCEPRGGSIGQISNVGGVPPPPYRSDDNDSSRTWSDYSFQSTGMGKRRASWTNLVESDENLHRHHFVNPYPPHVTSLPAIVSVANGRCYGPPLAYANVGKIANGTGSRTNSFTNSQASEFIHIPRDSVLKLNKAGAPPAPSTSSGNNPVPRQESRLQSILTWLKSGRTPWIILALVVLIIIAIIVAIVVTQVAHRGSTYHFSWQPPDRYRSSASQGALPNSSLAMTIDGNQVQFDLNGNLPFKGAFVSIYDFGTNRVAIIDRSLKNNGKNLVCFLMQLNRTMIPSIAALKTAAVDPVSRSTQQLGWDEYWYFTPEPLDASHTGGLFSPPIDECKNVRWINLKQVPTDQKSQKCSECHDFCLPDYGIEKDYVRDETYLNIARRDCFYLFVPEWRNFAPSHNAEQNQRDFEQYYRQLNQQQQQQPQQQGASINYMQQQQQPQMNMQMQQTPNGAISNNNNNNVMTTGNSTESKWISLHQLPNRTLSNLTSSILNPIIAAGQSIFDTGSTVSLTTFPTQTPPLFPQNNYQQTQMFGQQQVPIGYGTNGQQQNPNGFNGQYNSNSVPYVPQQSVIGGINGLYPTNGQQQQPYPNNQYQTNNGQYPTYQQYPSNIGGYQQPVTIGGQYSNGQQQPYYANGGVQYNGGVNWGQPQQNLPYPSALTGIPQQPMISNNNNATNGRR